MLQDGTVTGGGSGSSPGEQLGSSIFLQGNQTLHLAPGLGQTLTIVGAIADDGQGGSPGLLVNGAGTVILNGQNSYVGGIGLQSGTLVLGTSFAAGQPSNNPITFTAGSLATLDMADTTLPSGAIAGFAGGDKIIVSDFVYAAGDTIGTADANTVVIANADGSVSDRFGLQGAGSDSFVLSAAAGGGTEITLASAVPAVTEGLTHDTGSSASDGITANPALSGTADANTVVTFTEGASVLGTTTADGSGNWTYTPTGLADGAHTIVASETNGASQTGTASVSFTLAHTAPAAPGGLALAVGSDSGVVGDGITNITAPAITGTGTNGDTVTLFDGATAVGSATVVNGVWSVTSSTLSAGAHTLTTQQTDVAGNASAPSVAFNLTVDTTVPVAPTSLVLASGSDSGTLGDGITDITAPSITGTGTTGDVVTLYDGATAVGSATVVGGTWTVAAGTLSAGQHVLTATQAEVAGNVSAASAALSLTIAAAPAAPGGLALATGSDSGVVGDGITNVTTPTITGTGTTGETVTLHDGATVLGTAVVTGGTWSIASGALAAGSHTLTAAQTDGAGDVSAASGTLALTIDTAVPGAPSGPALAADSDSGPVGDGITDVTLPTFTGTGANGATVTLYESSTVLGTAIVAGGLWSITAGSLLLDGSHSLTTTQTDVAGNVSAASAPVSVSIVDGIIDVATAAQLATAIGIADAATSGQGVTITLTADITETANLAALNIAAGASVTIDGGGHTLDGASTYGGLFVYAGNVMVQNLTFDHNTARGAAGAAAGGGAAGLGGGLFEGSGGTVTLAGVTFVNDSAIGGAGHGASGRGGSGGSFGSVPGFGVGGASGFGSGGGGGAGGFGAGGGAGAYNDSTGGLGGNGGAGGFGGGGGGGGSGSSGGGGGGQGGFGGGGGGLGSTSGSGTGGGGMGAGGDIFVQQGGSLTIEGGSLGTGAVGGGVGPGSDTSGSAFGNGIFLQGNQAISLAPGIGQTLTIQGGIADQTGSGGNGGNAGAGGITIDGAGTVVLAGADTYTGATTLESGTLVLGAAPGPSSIVFAAGHTATLAFVQADNPTSNVQGFANGDVIIVSDLAYTASSYATLIATNFVEIGNGLGTSIDLGIQAAANGTFQVSAATGGGTKITFVPVPTVTAALSNDTGMSASDGVTSNPALSGSADPYAVVTFTQGSSILGTTTADGAGNWTYAPTGLADGAHTIVATDTNSSSQTGTASISFTLATSAPIPGTLALATASDTGVQGDGITATTTPTITGTGITGDTIILYDGSTALGTATVTGGTWSIASSALGAGGHTLHATQMDAAGNVSADSGTFALTIDTTVPAAASTPILSAGSDSGVAGDHVTNNLTPTITGTGITGDTITLYDGTTAIGTGTVAGGAWSIITPTLSAGVHQLHSVQISVAGNTSAVSSTLALTIDTTIPALPGLPVLAESSDSGVAGDNLTNVTAPVISGTGTSGDTVTLYDETTAIGTATVVNGAWSIATPTLPDGVHQLHTTQTSVADNASTASGTLALTIDTAVPFTPATPVLATGSDSGLAGDNLTNITNPVITGTGTTGDTVTLYDGGTAIGTAVVVGGAWSLATGILAPGVHTLHDIQTSPAANVSAASATLALTVDTATPAAASTPFLFAGSDSGTVGDHLTNVTAPSITGTGITGDTIKLFDGTTLLGTATVVAGAWSIASLTLPDGVHSLHTTQTSPAGNVSAASAALALTVDTAMPAAPDAPGLSSASDSGVPGDNLTSITTPTITGTGTTGDIVTLYDGTTIVGSATVAGGAWSIATGVLAAGAHSLHTTQTSAAGNVSAASATLALTIDTAVPDAPSAPSLAPGSDSGVPGDLLTNDTTPMITGSGTTGDTVILYDGTTAIGTATIIGGAWSIAASALSNGVHSLTTIQTSPVGNVSAASGSLVLAIDTAAPVSTAAPVLSAGSDSGTVGDGITNVASPTLTGGGITGDSVTLYDGTTAIGTATVIGGVWSIPTGLLAPGVHDLHTVQTSPAGNLSAASGTLALTIDTASPDAAAIPALATASDSGTPGDGITSVTDPVITGTGADGDIVSLYDGTTLLGTGAVSGGTWSIAAGVLGNGAHSLHDVQTSPAGNASAASGTLALTIDSTMPATLAAPMLSAGSDSGTVGDGITNVTDPVIAGTGTDGDTVVLYDGTIAVGTATVAGGTWQITTDTLSAGVHTLTTTQTNTAGTVSDASQPLAITIDTTPPAASGMPVLATFSDSGVPGDGLTNVTTPTLTGTGINGDTVTLYDGTTIVGTATVLDGTWTIAAGILAEGMHALHTVQTGPSGNVSAASGTLGLTIDTALPSIPSTPALSSGSDSGTQGDNLTSIATPTLTGTGITGDIVTLYDGDTAIGTATVVGGTWSVTASTLGDGVHSLTTTQTSPAGNVSDASDPLALTIDTTIPGLPSVPMLSTGSDSGVAGDGLTNLTTPTISGTGITGDVVTLYDGTTVLGTAMVVAGGWSITAPALTDGVHHLHDVQVNAAGNLSAASGTLALTIDTASPDAAAIPALATASDSGTPGDGITSVTDPVITGTGADGDIVSLYDGTTLLGTGAVSGGTWSIAAGVLGNGAHSLHDVQTSPAGNASAASGTLALTIDSTMPATLAAPMLSAGSDSGTVGDGITNVTDPVIAGTGTDGDTVVLYDGTIAVGTATVAGGTWQITTGTLSAGVHTLTTTQTNTAGTVSDASQPLAITIDTTPPAASGMPVLATLSDSGVPGDGLTNVTTPTLTGTGINGDTVTLYDGTTIVGTATVSDSVWSITTNALGDGSHSLATVQTSQTGNVSAASTPLVLTIDTAAPMAASPPTLAASSDSGVPGDHLTNVTTPTLTGTGVTGDTVVLYDGMTAVGTAAVVNGAWSVTASALGNGVHTLTTVQTSPAGNGSAASAALVLTIDTTPPLAASVAMLAPASDSGTLGDGITNVTTPGLSGTGIVGDTVFLDDGSLVLGSAKVQEDGTWSITATPLIAGVHVLTTTQASPAGELSVPSAPLVLTIDPVGPAPTSIVQTTASGLTGAAAPGTTITLQDGTDILGTATTGTDGGWAFLPSTLAMGSYAVTATVTDVAGNVSAASEPVTIAVAADHSFTVASVSAGVTLVNHYSADDRLQMAVTTQPNGTAVNQTLDPAGAVLSTTTTSPQGLLLQSVTPAVTVRNIYDAGGTLIGTVTEAGSATGAAPPNYVTTGIINGALTATDAVPNVVHLLSEDQRLSLSGNDQIIVGSGNDTIDATVGSVSVTGGTGTLSFFGGSGTSTITGGSGVATIAGGSGGGLFVGGSGGGNLLVAGRGNTSLVGAAGHDVMFGGPGNTAIFGSKAGSDTIVGGAGNSTVAAADHDVVFAGEGRTTVFSGAGGNDTVIGGGGGIMVAQGSGNALFAGTGQDTLFGGLGSNSLVGGSGEAVMVGGTGSTLFVGGTGHSTVFGGAGNDTVWSGNGQMMANLGGGANTVILGSGTAAITDGIGYTLYDVIAGQAGGNDVISGFKVGIDQIALFGYAVDGTPQVSGGSTILSLSDGTHITLLDVVGLQGNSIV